MSAFVYTMLTLQMVALMTGLARLARGKYPHISPTERWEDLMAFAINVALILWGLHTLAWGPK